MKKYRNICYYCRTPVKDEDVKYVRDEFTGITWPEHYWCASTYWFKKGWPSEEWCNRQDVLDRRMRERQEVEQRELLAKIKRDRENENINI